MLRICQQCNKNFKTRLCDVKRGKGKFCSKKCRGISGRSRVSKTCEFCSKKFCIVKSYKHKKYCSRKCFGLGHTPWNKGKSTAKEVKEKIRKAHLGKVFTEEHRKNLSKSQTGMHVGEKNRNWKGGKTKSEYWTVKFRRTREYKEWVKSIKERNDYICQKCEVNGSNVQIHADHIKPITIFPELKLDLNNGQALCRRCHNEKTSTDMKLIYQKIINGYNTEEIMV